MLIQWLSCTLHPGLSTQNKAESAQQVLVHKGSAQSEHSVHLSGENATSVLVQSEGSQPTQVAPQGTSGLGLLQPPPAIQLLIPQGNPN